MGDAVQTEGHALLKAVSQGKLRLARLLLEGGAYINEGNERGETALSAACMFGDAHVRTRMVRYLLEQGADPNMADSSGRTALMHAVHQRAGVHVVSLLLKHGADPSLKDYAGNSALTRALDQGGATLRLLLDACERRGHEVLILTCCSDGGQRTVRQYHHTAPERHHIRQAARATERNYERNHEGNHERNLERHHIRHFSTALEKNEKNPQERNQERSHFRQIVMLPEPQRDSDLAQSLSVNGLPSDLAPSDPTPPNPATLLGPTPEPLSAASPSDVHVASAHGDGVFSFSVAPPRPRPPRVRVLKRLNSEPWGLSVPRAPAPPPTQDEVELQKPPSLADCPLRRHSIEAHDPGLGEQLTERLTLADETTLELETQDSDNGGPEDDTAQSFRRRFLPPPCVGSSENLSNTTSPLVARRGRQGAGLLERRGSGTLLLDHLSQPRPGFLPPLFNPQRPIPDIRSTNPAPCGSSPAPGSASKRELRKKLLRRHSMQPEQMKLLSVFQHVLSENEEK
ncbi:ankyrin repeat domain-containing protein 34A-like [Periophthalmus magnuspinnatus]|uniref:ankyrin repeat domain-containing protein 34A-like n=1 Tax=Periophthalmus magnuspinnatus TaxID=409849 RepID=UPI002437251F|nr:ankyrin repeat domain-containing protein 34A-like [Periophthalmus magnuspinnatus]